MRGLYTCMEGSCRFAALPLCRVPPNPYSLLPTPCPPTCYTLPVTIEITGEVWYWRGPAPFFFVTVPEKHTRKIKSIEKLVTYGWGMIPVTVRIGKTEWTTTMFPKDGRYIVPLKAAVRKAEKFDVGDSIKVRLTLAD